MPKTFGAGQLRHTIKIQSMASTQNTFGEQTRTYTDSSSSVRAEVLNLNNDDRFSDPQFLNEDRKQFNIRYRSGVDVKDRIIYNSVTYDIESIIDVDERRRKLEIIAKRVTT